MAEKAGIPEAVCQVLDSGWEVALNEATGAFAIEREAVQQADQATAQVWLAREEAEQARGRFADQERQIALLTEQVERLTQKLGKKEEATSAKLRDELQELTAEHHQQQRRQTEELNRLQAAHQEAQGWFCGRRTDCCSRLD